MRLYCCSIANSCPTLCDPMDSSMPGFPVLHHILKFPQVFPGGSDSKESACNVKDLGSIPGFRKAPGEGHGSPLPYSCLENPYGQRSLMGYSP